MMNSRLGVFGNIRKPNRSSQHHLNLFYSQLISSVKRFLTICVPKFALNEGQWVDYRKRLISSCKTHGINIVCDSFKYFCYYRYNGYIGDVDIYPVPEVMIDFHPPGLKKYLDRRLSGRLRKRNLFLLISLQTLKRDLIQMPKEMVDKSLCKHKDTLSKLSSVDENVLTFVENYMRNEVSLLTKNRGFNQQYNVESVYPLSRNSSFLIRKKDGGVQRELSLNLNTNINQMTLRKFALINSSLTKQNEKLDRDLINKSHDSIHGNARVCAILEPLKVRIVTCEDQFNQLVKPIQVKMWKDLLRDECFLLTRNEDMVDYIKRYMSTDLLPLHVSGDYSAATDNLNPYIIKSVLTELSTLIPPHLRSVFTKNGGKHFLHYSDGTSIEQSNGQLMGSLTSFPILCLVNKIAYEYARTLCPDGLSEHCLINGDDIYFKCNLKGYNVWTQTVKKFGLDPSIGKNYVSAKVFLINSRYFLVRKQEIVEIPFVNWRLINSRSSTQVREISRDIEIQTPVTHDPSALGSMYRKFLQQAGSDPLIMSPLLRRLDRVFYISHREVINSSPKELYIPSCLGGLGALTIPEFRKTHILSKQRKTKMVKGFKFNLSLYALRNNINITSPDLINKVGCAMAKAVCHVEKLDGDVLSPIKIPQLTRINKSSSGTSSLRKFWRAIGKSNFLKTRTPDGVPNLL